MLKGHKSQFSMALLDWMMLALIIYVPQSHPRGSGADGFDVSSDKLNL